MSIAGGVETAFERAEQVCSDAVQIFTKNQRQWRAKPLEDDTITAFKKRQEETGIGPVVAHNSYLINMASPKDELWEKSVAAQRDELERCEALGVPFLVSHPGAHTGSGREAGIEQIVKAIDRLNDELSGFQVKTLLETTAGQGTSIGGFFEDLYELLNSVKDPDRVGVCLDSCHIFVAGYDIRDNVTYQVTMAQFEELIGFDKLYAIHFNDSKGELGSHRDRHDYIGQGFIGTEGFRNFMNDARLKNCPALLETDKSADLHEDKEAIDLLRSLVAA